MGQIGTLYAHLHLHLPLEGNFDKLYNKLSNNMKYFLDMLIRPLKWKIITNITWSCWVMTEIFGNEQMTTFSVITENEYLFHNKIGNDWDFL